MATFLYSAGFRTGWTWVEKYFWVDPFPRRERDRPIVCLCENTTTKSAEVYARFRSNENHLGHIERFLAVLVRLPSAAPRDSEVLFNIFMEGDYNITPVNDGPFGYPEQDFGTTVEYLPRLPKSARGEFSGPQAKESRD